MAKEDGGYVARSIFSERGLIGQNVLDTISDVLGSEFSRLISIHSNKFNSSVKRSKENIN